MGGLARKSKYGKWRTISLFAVYFLFLLHFLHWKLKGQTLAPLELSEVLITIHQGVVTAGFILMFLVMILTLVFGRFFCSWACHLLALQDACAWLMKKAKIKPRVIRSRFLLWIPFGAVFYLFVWPQIALYINGIEVEELRMVAETTKGGWSSFQTTNFWRNLPPAGIAILTFLVCGFLLVYVLGSRSFCYYGCPYGAVFSAADQLALARITLTGNCIQCGVCTANCNSDILVHKEIKEFGMVTNSRCMKDLDCVGSCPEKAIKVKFTKPPLFRKKFKLPAYKKRYDFTLAEDLSMAGLFVIFLVIYRGLYDALPFLLSIGIAITAAYFAIIGYRMIKKMSVKLGGLRLKISNKLTGLGWSFAFFSVLFYLFSIHSAYVHYHNYMGQLSYEKILEQQKEFLPTDDIPSELVNDALYHFEIAYEVGFFVPLDLRKPMASLYLLTGENDKGEEQLSAIIEDHPENVEALYRFGIICLERGQLDEAANYFSQAMVDDAEFESEREFYVRGAAALELGKLYDQSGDLQNAVLFYNKSLHDDPSKLETLLAISIAYMKMGEFQLAITHLETGLTIDPQSAIIYNNLGALYAQSGNSDKAIENFESVIQNGVDNAQVRFNLGMLYYGKGDLSTALLHLDQAIRFQPDHAKANEAYNMLINELNANETS